MLFDIVPLIIILICFSAIIFIVVKKFPQLANIDVEKIPKEQQAKIKRTIMENRLRRHINNFIEKLFKFLEPAGVVIKNNFIKLKNQIIFLEKRLY